MEKVTINGTYFPEENDTMRKITALLLGDFSEKHPSANIEHFEISFEASNGGGFYRYEIVGESKY